MTPATSVRTVMTRSLLLGLAFVAVATAASAQPVREAEQATVSVIRANGDAPPRSASADPIALGGSGLERVFAVASDAAGNSYVTGEFAGTIDFDPGPGQAVATSAGQTDFFGASYDPAGLLRWAFRYGSTQAELGSGVAVADGRVFFGGNFNGTAAFGPAGSVTSAGSLDGLVLAVDATTGAFVWASAFGGALADGNPRLATAGGRVFVDTRFIGPADFDDGPGTTILPASDSYDAALASFSAATGALQWARVILGGTGQQFEGGVDATATTVYATAADYGNSTGIVGAYSAVTGAPVFVTPTPGVTPYDVVFDGTRAIAAGVALPNASTTDVWIAAFSASGAQGWTHTLGGAGRDVTQAISLIGSRVVVGGDFEQTVDFDPGAGSALRTSAGGSDGFIALYEAATGAFVQAEALGGTGTDNVYAVDGGPTRAVLGGDFSATAELDPTPGQTTTRTAVDFLDAFVALYFPDGPVTSFAVTTTSDAGPGSLRQALLDAGANGGGTVTFAIPGAGPHTIALATPLAFLNVPVVIDAFTQPGAQPNTAAPWQPSTAVHAVVLSGATVGATGSGLVLQGAGSIVRGLAIVDFPWYGLVLEAVGAAAEGNVIGTDDAGTAGLGNGISGIWVLRTARVGGASPAQRNVISGNANFGVLVYGSAASGTQLQGTFIGTTPDGATALGNGFSGVYTGSTVVFNEPNPTQALDVRIGGTQPGEGNLISANTGFGVELQGFNQSGAATTLGDTRVQGNCIGTNAAGTAALPNMQAGVLVRRNPTGITLGGSAPGAGNLVSGNRFSGLLVEVSDAVLVEGNLVGTDATGTLPLGNGQTGITLVCSRNAVVRGNVSGANGTGTGTFVGSGIGASCPIAGVTGSGNRIVGNWVGTDRTGTIPLGNAGNNGQGGVTFSRAHSGDVLGGDGPGDANVIAFNAGPAVLVRSTIAGPITIRRNSTYANTGFGIDLEPAGRAVNDPGDADAGANRQQNYPVVTSVTGNGVDMLTVSYSVDTAAANATYPLTVDVYRADAAGREGRTWVGQATYTTPQAAATASFTPAVVVADGDRFVATATDAAGNTSEVSDAVTGVGAVASEGATGDDAFAIALAPNPVRSTATLTLTVGRPGPATVAVFDALGRRVAVLHDGPLAVGAHALTFDAAGLAPGVYVVRAVAGEAMLAQRLTVIR